MIDRRVSLKEIAGMLGVKETAARSYTYLYAEGCSKPTFPDRGRDGLWSALAIRLWHENRLGRGAGKRDGLPCQLCGAMTAKRLRDVSTGLMACRECRERVVNPVK